jgi:hypothetical protein
MLALFLIKVVVAKTRWSRQFVFHGELAGKQSKTRIFYRHAIARRR